MPTPGDHSSNPITGEKVKFLRTSNSAGDEDVQFDLELRPVSVPGGFPHTHRPAERFDVTDGELFAFVGGQGFVRAKAGDSIEIPAGRVHVVFAFRRASARVTISPGMHFDELIEAGAEVARGDLRRSTLRRLARLMAEHEVIPRPPSRYPSLPRRGSSVGRAHD